MQSFFAAFMFFSHSNICLNKDLQFRVLVPFLKIINVLGTFHFECTCTKKYRSLFLCNIGTKAKNVTLLTLGSDNYDVHKK